MKKTSSGVFFFLSLLFYLIQLIVVGYELITPFKLVAHDALTWDQFVWLSFVEHSLFLEPLLIIPGIIGLLKRDVQGFTLALIYPYFLLTFGIMTLLNYQSPIGYYQMPMFLFSFILISLINLNAYNDGINKSKAFLLNLKSLGLALVLFFLISEMIKNQMVL